MITYALWNQIIVYAVLVLIWFVASPKLNKIWSKNKNKKSNTISKYMVMIFQSLETKSYQKQNLIFQCQKTIIGITKASQVLKVLTIFLQNVATKSLETINEC